MLFYLFAVSFFATAGLVAWFHGTKRTFPGRIGDGGWDDVAVTVGAGWLLAWLAFYLVGISHPIKDAQTDLAFAKGIGGFLMYAAYFHLTALFALLGVAVYNTYHWGRAAV